MRFPTRKQITTWTGHYIPMGLPIILVLIQCTVTSLADREVGAQDVGGGIVYAMLAFWLWAVTTNGHSRRMASSSGKKRGTDKARAEELLQIVFLGSITTLLYLVCYHPAVGALSLMIAFVAVGLPAFCFMETP